MTSVPAQNGVVLGGGSDAWRGRGCPVPVELGCEVGSVLEKLDRLVGSAPRRSAAFSPADFPSAEASLQAASVLLRRMISDAETDGSVATQAVALLVEVTAVQRALQEAQTVYRLAAVTKVQEGLARLSRVGSVSGLIDRAPEEVCRLGFDRAFISQVHGSVWVPEAVHVRGDPESAGAILDAGRSTPQQLNHMILETDMVRRHGPLLVTGVQDDPRVNRSIAAASGSRSYVAAPIMPAEGTVIGFLHADRYLQGRHVDESDRDVLWMFAQGFGHAFERAVLLERLSGLRGEVTRLTGEIATVMDQFVNAEVEVARSDGQRVDATRRAAAAVLFEESDSSSLTRRETEVLRLLANGETNAEIAARLVISAGTVKYHVKNILRKLSAANRAEAVSIYLRAERDAQTAPNVRLGPFGERR